MSGFHEKHFDDGGIRTRYLVNTFEPGNDIVVLLHDGAWGASAEMTWGRLLGFLGARFNVLAPDLLGFGGSDKLVFLDQSPYQFRLHAILRLLESLQIHEPVHLVGNSFGGSVALRAIADDKWRSHVASVTSISGTGGPWREQSIQEQIGTFDGSREDLERIMRILIDPFDGFDVYVDERYEWARVPGHFQSMMAPHIKAPEKISTRRMIDSYPESLAGVSTPVHLIAGKRDKAVMQGWYEHIVNVMPNTKVSRPDANHCPNISNPRETSELISNFIQSNPVNE
jgi:pimeloyl-ACP methyl ester carboxylesterase